MEYLENSFLKLLDKTSVPQKKSIKDFFDAYNQKESFSHIIGLEQLENCTNFDEIYYVELINENIYELPTSLFKCKNLKSLDLSANFISSIDGIGSFSQLEFLFLDDCELLREIPSEIGQLKILKVISISNTIIQSLPKEFYSLKNITYCRLHENELTNEILYDIEELENIVELHLDSNEMLNEDGTTFSLTNLVKAHINHNNFETLPIDFAGCPLIEHLDISYNPIQELPNSITNLQNLKELDLDGCLLKNIPNLSSLISCEKVAIGHHDMKEIPLEIFSIPNLKILKIDNSKIKTIPVQVANLKKLESLSISDCELITLPSSIGKLTKLQEVELRDNKIKEIPLEMGSLKKLTRLSFSNWNEGQNKIAKLPNWIGNLSSLEELGISNIQLELLPKEIGKLTKLSNLDLSSNPLRSLPPEFADLRKLKSLNLFECTLEDMPEVQDMGIDELFEYLNRLRGIGKYSFVWELPQSLQTAFQQYLNFFTDYIKKLRGYEINLSVVKTPSGLRIETEVNGELTIEQVGNYLNEYLDYIKQDIEFRDVGTNDDSKLDLLRLQMETQINHFKQQVRQVEFENKYLRNTVDKLLEAQINFSQGIAGNRMSLPYETKEHIQENEFSRIKNLIVKNEFEKAFNDLSLLIKEKHPTKLNEVLALYSRMNQVKIEARIGSISFEQKRIEMNKIVSSLLEFLQSL